MSRDVSGSNRKFTAEGISFRVAADANFTEMISKFENSMIATSGKNMRKMVKRVTSREGVVLVTNAAERDVLKSFAEQLDPVAFTYTNAAGDKYRCTGSLEIENNETEENRTTCQVLPDEDWTTFLGA